MKQPDQIIFIESDEISLFLAESILSAYESQHSVSYYTDTEKALDYVQTLHPSAEITITFFISAVILMGEDELIRQIKNLLLPFSSRFCLLTSMASAEKREKEFIREIGISCFIEKPLTEEKLIQALKLPVDSRASK